MSEIAKVLQHYGAGKVPYGRGWRKMNCPFHGDSHASAGVNHDEQAFNCLGCDMSGDVFEIIKKADGINFNEAKRRAEEITGADYQSLRKGHQSGGRLSRQSGTISSRRKEASSGSSEASNRRSRIL
jgi:DNA primase